MVRRLALDGAQLEGVHYLRALANADAVRKEGAPRRLRQGSYKDGRTIPADVVVCGVGAVPDIALAHRAGLELGPRGGVLCDRQLRTSFDGLFGAGDMCEYRRAAQGETARIEH